MRDPSRRRKWGVDHLGGGFRRTTRLYWWRVTCVRPTRGLRPAGMLSMASVGPVVWTRTACEIISGDDLRRQVDMSDAQWAGAFEGLEMQQQAHNAIVADMLRDLSG